MSIVFVADLFPSDIMARAPLVSFMIAIESGNGTLKAFRDYPAFFGRCGVRHPTMPQKFELLMALGLQTEAANSSLYVRELTVPRSCFRCGYQ